MLPVKKRPKLSWEENEIAHRYWAQGWSHEELAAEYGKHLKSIHQICRRYKFQAGSRVSKAVEQAKAIQLQQIQELSRECVARFKKTGKTTFLLAFAKLNEALKGDPSSNQRQQGSLTQVNVQANQQGPIVQIEEVEDWYGEHAKRAHASGPNHASFTQAIAAHQRRIAQSSAEQGDLLRETVEQNSHKYADDPAGPRADSGPLAGSPDTSEREFCLDGHDPWSGETLDLA